MAIYETEAIVLGATNWGEADKIVTLLTREKGKVRAVAYGSRRAKSPLSSLTQLFNVADLQLFASAHGLDIVRSYAHKFFLADLSYDYEAFGYGAFVAELICEFCEEKEAQPELYEKILLIVPSFKKRKPRIVALAAFYQILECTGYQLQYKKCVKCGNALDEGAAFSLSEGGALCHNCKGSIKDKFPYKLALQKLIATLLDFKWQDDVVLNLSAQALKEAEKLMIDYLRYIFNKDLKSLAFIQQLLASQPICALKK